MNQQQTTFLLHGWRKWQGARGETSSKWPRFWAVGTGHHGCFYRWPWGVSGEISPKQHRSTWLSVTCMVWHEILTLVSCVRSLLCNRSKPQPSLSILVTVLCTARSQHLAFIWRCFLVLERCPPTAWMQTGMGTLGLHWPGPSPPSQEAELPHSIPCTNPHRLPQPLAEPRLKLAVSCPVT